MGLLKTNQSTWNKKTVLFVHGIGLQPKGYSQPLYELLRAEDPQTVDATRWHEVAYDHVNQTFEQKVLQFNGALTVDGAKPALKATAGDFIVDLIDYLALSDPYHWINNVFRKELLDIVEAGQRSGVNQIDHEIYILSHSLGTVVSYEALHAIIDDPQTLGITSNFNIRAFFTFGSPLAFIKANQKKIPHLNDQFALRAKPIGRPTRVNTFTDETQTNVIDWFNLSQKYDPVASLVPLTEATANDALSAESFTFDGFHAGANPHAFDNYIKEYAGLIMEKIRA